MCVLETAVGIDDGIMKTSLAECLGVNMAAAVTPEVKCTAFYTQGGMAAVAVYHGRQFTAAFARGRIISNNFHGGIYYTQTFKSQCKFYCIGKLTDR